MFRKTSISLMTTYLVIIVLYCGPLAAGFFADTFFPNAPETEWVKMAGMSSPFAAAFAVPLDIDMPGGAMSREGNWMHFGLYVAFTTLFVGALLGLMVWMFNTRWRVSE